MEAVALAAVLQQNNNHTSNAVTTPTTTAGMTTIATNTSSSLHVAGDNVCLLKTAVANVYANNTGIEANVLLDEGSQSSFLAEGLARSLRLQPDYTEDISLASFGSSAALVRRLDLLGNHHRRQATTICSSGTYNCSPHSECFTFCHCQPTTSEGAQTR